MKYISKQLVSTTALLTLAVVLALVFASAALAQGQGGNAGSGSGDQDQDRDRIQDPATHDADGPDQDRDRLQDQDRTQDPATSNGPVQDRDRLQDQDRIQDPAVRIGDELIQDRDQLRDRLQDRMQDPDYNPDQDRDRDRIHAANADGMREIVSISREVSDEVIRGLNEEMRELMRNRNRVQVSAIAMSAAQNLTGQFGQRIAEAAQDIDAAYGRAIAAEQQLQNRSWLRSIFFGGDRQVSETIHNQVQTSTERMTQLRQYIADCECDESVRTMLQEQLTVMEEEHARIREIADREGSRWGIFSWRF